MTSVQNVQELSEYISILFEQNDKQQKEINNIQEIIIGILKNKRDTNAHYGKTESPSTDITHQSDDKTDTRDVKKYTGKYLKLITVIIFVLLIGISVILYFVIHNNTISEDYNGKPDTDTLDNVTYIGTHKLLTRRQWGGRPMRNNTKPLQHPVPLIIISHTVTDYCSSIKDCSLIVQSIQSDHVTRFGSPDAGYNFLIGGDGNIYVARGWDIVNFHKENTIGISFIGNYVFDNLSENMIDATKLLLQDGVEKGKLSNDYKIVCHNQTFNTVSPGPNVYKIVKTWEHFDPRKVYE